MCIYMLVQYCRLWMLNINKKKTKVIMDWAMKFLPVQYREQMNDIFGQRGGS